MNQAVHIFRKDVRHLWPQVAVVLFLFVLHAVVDVRRSPVYNPETKLANSLSSLLTVLLPLAMWFLIASVVFQEELPGNHQYWPTRPYKKSSLLAAKVLFLIIFINVPWFLSDCCILGFQDFAVVGVMDRILLRQIPLTILFILPSLAIATLTAGLAQFLLASFFVVLAPLLELIVVESFRSASGPGITFGPLLPIVLATVTCAIIIWQYWRRQTGWARIFAACVLVAFFPALSGFSLLGNAFARNTEQPKPNESGVHVAYDNGEQPRGEWKSAPPGTSLIRILLRVDGLPPETLLRGTGLASIEVNHAPWPKAGWKYAASVERDSDGRYWQRMILPEAQLSKVRQQIADVRTSLRLEVVTDRVAETTTLSALAIHPSIIPGIGRCRTLYTQEQASLYCQAGLEDGVETQAQIGPRAGLEADLPTFAPQEVRWGLSPIANLGVVNHGGDAPSTVVAFIPRRRISSFRETLDLHDVQLEKYAMP